MSFTTLYRCSFYLMLVCSTLVLSIDATESRFAMLYPLAVAVGGAVAFLTVDRRPGAGLSPSFGSLLALGATALCILEFLIDRNMLLLALGHWLVYLQLIYMFRVKSVETDWWMFSLGLVQVMVGSVISQNETVGSMLFCWAVLALWVLGLFSLQREASRARTEDGVGERARFLPGEEPYPGLLNLPFLFSAMRVTLTTLALGGVIFLAMPRWAGGARSLRGRGHAQHLTGFDDEVQLGQLGEILENDSVVMSIELFDEHDKRIVPRDDWEPLWRGATMATYERGRWKRPDRHVSGDVPFQAEGIGEFDPEAAHQGVIRQQIKLEANDSPVLFGIRPIFDASTTASAFRGGPEMNPIDGTLVRNDVRQGTYDYEVRSYRNLDIPQPGEKSLGPYNRTQGLLLEVPDDLRDTLRARAEAAIAARVPPEKRDDTTERARALESYLRDSGEFGYSLKLDVIDGSIDPVEDFLVNRKEGHCEYFASALALMLRSVGIPSRVVNGFKGGDWNGFARILSVRQKHVHSWVEAYLGEVTETAAGDGMGGGGLRRRPIWLTLDPTPGQERDRSVAQVGGIAGRFRQFTDLVRYVWVFYIVGYDQGRQKRLLYDPIIKLVTEARRGFRMMGESLQWGWARLLHWLHFPTTKSFFSVRGFLVSFAGLCLICAVGWLILRSGRWLWSRFLGPDLDPLALSPGAAQYRRLASLLAEYGLERPPAETHDEFARRASVFLTGRGTSTEPVVDVPRIIVEAFYRVRFGHRELSEAAAAALESCLDALEQSLRASQA
jgi:transglutaminase-like putative cysteine protease